MASYDTSPYPVYDDHPEPGSRLRRILFTICSVLFIAGGFVFGFVFVSRVEAALGIAGQRILGVAIPTDLRSPISMPRLPQIGLPSLTPRQDDSNSEAVWSGKDRVNVLLLGVDTRPDERGQPTRSDTIMIASIDPVHKTGALVSVPRDLWVPIPIDSSRPIEDKITAAHFYGDYFNYPGGGPALAKRTIEYNLGVRIHYYAKIDFDGFEQVVDTLGGISVCVERPLIDNEYPTRDYGYMQVYIPAGLQHLDGERALQYARSRHQDSDFGRVRRQQQVLMAIRDKALRLDILPKLPQLMQQFSDSIETDLSPLEIIQLANLAMQIDRSSIKNVVLDGDAVESFWTSGGAAALMPVRSEIQKIISETLYDPATYQPPADEPEASAADVPAEEPEEAPASRGTSRTTPTPTAPATPTPVAAADVEPSC